MPRWSWFALALSLSGASAACGRTALSLPEPDAPARAPEGGRPAESPSATDAQPGGAGDSAPSSGGAGLDQGAAPLRPFPCRLAQRFTLVTEVTDTFACALAVGDDHFGVIWIDTAALRRLKFQAFRFDGQPLADAVTVAMAPIQPKVALVARGSTLVAAWVDTGGAFDVRATTFAKGLRVSDSVIAESDRADDPTLVISEKGLWVLSWTRSPTDMLYPQRVYVTSTDGMAFRNLQVLSSSGAKRFTASSSARVPGGVALAWVERTIPDHSALLYSVVDDLGVHTEPVVLAEHERYIYDTATAFAGERVAIATTDSRVDIGVVPLYLTLLTSDGALISEGLRLTRDHHHEAIDMAAGSQSFVVIANVFVGAESENVVFVRQVDGSGNLLFDPLRLSGEQTPAGTRHAQEPRIVPIAGDRFVAVWGERELHAKRGVYAIRGGIVDCGSGR